MKRRIWSLKKNRAKIEAIKLPEGYTLEWGGEYESSPEAKEGIASSIPMKRSSRDVFVNRASV
ncbi:hypothetical protein P4S72_27810 [Vibrio sp. PP-XX7]